MHCTSNNYLYLCGEKSSNILESIHNPYKITNKAIALAKATKNVVAAFVDLSKTVSKIFIYLEPVKVIQIPLSIKKSIKTATSMYHTDSWKRRLLGVYQEARCLKKFTSGATSALKFAVGLELLGEATLSWTDIAGYIFFPISAISVALAANMLTKRAVLLRDFNRYANIEKNGILKACQFFAENKKRFRKLKVIVKDSAFDERFDRLVKGIECGSVFDSKKAAKILQEIKGRIQLNLAISIVKTSIKATGCVITILGFVTVIGILPAVFIDLGLATGSLSVFAASKYFNSRPLNDRLS